MRTLCKVIVTLKLVGGVAQVPAVFDATMVLPMAKTLLMPELESTALSQMDLAVVSVKVAVCTPSEMVTTGGVAQAVTVVEAALMRIIW